MYVFIIIFLFTKYCPINALLCMTNKDGSILAEPKCEFVLNINNSIPPITQFLAKYSQCAIHNADSVVLLGHSDGSCFADVDIDYVANTMRIHLTHVTAAQSLLSPYDDMFGFANGIKSVVQFKVVGNLEKKKINLITRLQCKTSDNCALDKIRYLLSNLTNSHTRLSTFKDTIKLLHNPMSKVASGLSCLYDGEDMECSNGEDRCIFDLSKGSLIRNGCFDGDSNEIYDLEYRFNMIEEIASDGFYSVHDAFKIYYLCNTDLCNNDDIVEKVDHLLYSFVLGSSSNDKIVHRNISYIKPLPSTPPKPKPLV
ncbi:unnamed protein product [Rotaria magnacalcarata]|uniref:Uncharacterized protein n=1 Tax=Rotaria magnacalcarata TaxID=392030 RepID=A0A816YP10_9BILA|nr:unnamed protein product [Rotaria magnacalcarata]